VEVIFPLPGEGDLKECHLFVANLLLAVIIEVERKRDRSGGRTGFEVPAEDVDLPYS